MINASTIDSAAYNSLAAWRRRALPYVKIADIVKISEVNCSTVSMFENNKIRVTEKVLGKLAQAYGLSPDECHRMHLGLSTAEYERRQAAAPMQ